MNLQQKLIALRLEAQALEELDTARGLQPWELAELDAIYSQIATLRRRIQAAVNN